MDYSSTPVPFKNDSPRKKKMQKTGSTTEKGGAKTEAGQGQSKQQQVESQVLSSNFAELIS